MGKQDQALRDARLVFYKDDVDAINAILDAFLKASGSKCALLIDKDGHMVTHRGDTARIDIDTISALVAGSFAATREMARILGEDEFTALYHQGKSDNIQLSLVGERALLTTIFDEATTIGMVRLYATEAAKRLTALFTRRRQEPTPRAPAESDPEFRASSAAKLDSLFGR